jgi:hypothetical protein
MFTHVANSEILYILVKLAVLGLAVGLWWLLATPIAV